MPSSSSEPASRRSFALWWTYFLVHATVLEARREDHPLGVRPRVPLRGDRRRRTGLHVIGYAYDPEYEVGVTTVVASIAVPVLVFMIVRYLMQAWLVSAPPR